MIEMISDYQCKIKYHLGKPNVLAKIESLLNSMWSLLITSNSGDCIVGL